MRLRLRDRFLRWLEAGRYIPPEQQRDIEASRKRLDEIHQRSRWLLEDVRRRLPIGEE